MIYILKVNEISLRLHSLKRKTIIVQITGQTFINYDLY